MIFSFALGTLLKLLYIFWSRIFSTFLETVCLTCALFRKYFNCTSVVFILLLPFSHNLFIDSLEMSYHAPQPYSLPSPSMSTLVTSTPKK